MKVRVLAFLVLIAFVSSACASGEGPLERSGQENYGRVGAGLGGLAGGIAGAVLGGKRGVLLGATVGAVTGGLLGSGIGGAVKNSQDPKMLCFFDTESDSWRERDSSFPCMFDVSRGEGPPVSVGQHSRYQGRGGYDSGNFGPQPGRGYYSTEDCGQWRQHGLEEACNRRQSRDGSNQRNGAFQLGRDGGDCQRFGMADLREECFRGRKMTRDREAKRYYNYTR